MSNLWKTPKVSVTPPPPPQQDAEEQTKKLEKSQAVRVRALQELNANQGAFVRKTGLRY